MTDLVRELIRSSGLPVTLDASMVLLGPPRTDTVYDKDHHD